jgi:hypothetical protein
VVRPLALVLTQNHDVLTQHGNNSRTGATLVETQLTPTTVRSSQFGRLFSWSVDGELYAQPLYLSQVKYGDHARNMVIAATMNNSVYAFEAPSVGSVDAPSQPLWHTDQRSLGNPLPYNFFAMKWWILGHNIDSSIGIASTPVIDRERGTVYLTAKSGHKGFFGFGRKIQYRIFALELTTGKIIASTDIVAAAQKLGLPAAQFDAEHHLQRAALLESGNSIYVAFGSHQDSTPYHGWVMQFDVDTLALKHVFCTSCGSRSADNCDTDACGGIWQAGGGPAADAAGNVYVMTGNGPFDKASLWTGTSFIKLDPDLWYLGSWTPPNYACLTKTDSDLGSAGPLLLEDGTLLGGGKQGVLYAIPTASMQGPVVGAGHALDLGAVADDPCAVSPVTAGGAGDPNKWAIQAAPLWESSAFMELLRLIAPAGLAQGYHHIHGAPVSWSTDGKTHLLYISAERDVLRAFSFDQGFSGMSAPGKAPVDTYQSRCANSQRGMPGGFLTLSAEGTATATGIIWATMPRRNHDALNSTVPGVLRAYSAVPGASGYLDELWNSDEGANPVSDRQCGADTPITSPDVLGKLAKFAPPTVAEGKVYVGTFSKELIVYGLRPTKETTLAIDAAAVGGVRLTRNDLPKTVSPGEIVQLVLKAENLNSANATGVRLSSKLAPDFVNAVSEGAAATKISRSAQARQSYSFNLHLRMPEAEGTYYYDWQLMSPSAGAGSRDQWLGTPTEEWQVQVLNPMCATLRMEAASLLARLPAPTSSASLDPALLMAMNDIKNRAESKGCRLNTDAEDVNMKSP